MSCYENHRNIPQKFEIISKYFAKVGPIDKTIILDIGGISSYYDALKMIVPRGELCLLNINPNEVKEVNTSIVEDATELPFKDETFDVIMSFDLIEHLINPDNLLAESFRILKRGGWFVISTPNLADFYSRMTFLFGYTPFSYNPSKFRVAAPFSKLNTNMGHKSVFTYKGLKQVLSIHGFEVIKSEGYCYYDCFYLTINPEKRKRQVGFYKFRETLDKLLPKDMEEGMLFICRKVKK